VSGPVHLMPSPGAEQSLCGLSWEVTPVVWVRFAQAHIDGRGMPVCPECAAVVGWSCRRCGFELAAPTLFSEHQPLAVDGCTRCVSAQAR
jgi:hypothetical protein